MVYHNSPVAVQGRARVIYYCTIQKKLLMVVCAHTLVLVGRNMEYCRLIFWETWDVYHLWPLLRQVYHV